ncbi:MAG: tRNA (guanosine(37)-N1)-methyltransferase TrmD, partial [Patescibacteria group bacterium]
MKQFDIITIFPQILESYFSESLFKRAKKNKIIKIKTHDLRKWTKGRHHTVDDRPYGGGFGLVFKFEPIAKALKAVVKKKKSRIILTSANGKKFDQKI